MRNENRVDLLKQTFIEILFFAGMVISIVREEYNIALISGFFVIVFLCIGMLQSKKHARNETDTFGALAD